MTTMSVIGDGRNIPGVISYSRGSLQDHFKRTNAQSNVQASTTSQTGAQANQSGGLMGQFNDLLQQRQGIQNDKMSLQESQLQKINTQKNNAAFSNAFATES